MVCVPAFAHGVIQYDNGKWFDGRTFQARTVYSVEGVLAFEHEGAVDSVVDLRSGYVIPPFGDAHSHALAGLGPAETLDLLTRATPRRIFPGRKIGRLAAGYESSLLVLDADPLQDAGALTRIRARVKSGHLLEIAPETALASPAGPLMHKAMTEGVGAAIAEYRRLKQDEPEAWDFSEQALNALGYALMNHDRLDDAVAIFKLNVEVFPDAANPYDSLREAYLKRGDRKLALLNYRRSLELNPRNEGAREKLKEIAPD